MKYATIDIDRWMDSSLKVVTLIPNEILLVGKHDDTSLPFHAERFSRHLSIEGIIVLLMDKYVCRIFRNVPYSYRYNNVNFFYSFSTEKLSAYLENPVTREIFLDRLMR